LRDIIPNPLAASFQTDALPQVVPRRLEQRRDQQRYSAGARPFKENVMAMRARQIPIRTRDEMPVRTHDEIPMPSDATRSMFLVASGFGIGALAVLAGFMFLIGIGAVEHTAVSPATPAAQSAANSPTAPGPAPQPAPSATTGQAPAPANPDTPTAPTRNQPQQAPAAKQQQQPAK